jgi:serine/threonine protein phosphatase 1
VDRTLVISDIHGCFFQFIELLNRVGYNADTDRLILLGDYVDRGNASKDVVEMVQKMVQGSNVIALRGNHDQRFIDLMMGDDECATRFFQHGGLETLRSYARIDDEANWRSARESIREHYPHHLSFLSRLPLYHEDDQHIFVHAGLNPEYVNWKEQPTRDFMWIREKFIHQETSVKKTIIFGHTRTMDIHGSANIWFGGDKIGIDGGCSFGQQLNCLEISGNCDYITHIQNASANTDTKSI